MKKTLLLTLASCSPLAAFSGFYAGGSLGGHLAQGSQTGSTIGTFSTDVYPSSLQQELFDRDVAGICYAGYGVQWYSLYLAAEAVMQFSYAHLQSQQTDNSLTISSNTAFITTSKIDSSIHCLQGGIDFKPGWVLNPATLLYGRIGIGAAKGTLKAQTTNLGQTVFGSGSLSSYSSNRKVFTTLRAGGGVEERLSSRLTVRGDYIFTDYGKLSVSSLATGTSSGFAFPLTLRNDTHVHFYDHALLLGLSYHFCCHEPICIDSCCALLSFQGPYLGGAIGGSALTMSNSGDVYGENPQLNRTNQHVKVPSQSYENQFQGMGFLGYGGLWRRGYLGMEAFASGVSNTTIDYAVEELFYDSANDTRYSTTYDLSVKSSTWQYGFDFRPGAVLTPLTILYGRVGVAAAEIKSASSALFTANNGAGITWTLPEESSADRWTAAFRLGLGLEQFLTSKLHLRADYVFTNYGVVSFSDSVTGVDSDGNTTLLQNNLSSHLQNNAFFLGISYYFH